MGNFSKFKKVIFHVQLKIIAIFNIPKFRQPKSDVAPMNYFTISLLFSTGISITSSGKIQKNIFDFNSNLYKKLLCRSCLFFYKDAINDLSSTLYITDDSKRSLKTLNNENILKLMPILFKSCANRIQLYAVKLLLL
jgi:predicted nucleic-acid-binding Zn-ribbon protein